MLAVGYYFVVVLLLLYIIIIILLLLYFVIYNTSKYYFKKVLFTVSCDERCGDYCLFRRCHVPGSDEGRAT
jgi:hypothetical protein